MKKMILLLAMMGFAQAAMATTYNCGVPATEDGQIRMGGSSYQVQVNGSKVYLLSKNMDSGHLRASKVEMDEKSHFIDAAVYTVDGIDVNFINGVVTLTEGNSSAICKRLPR